MSADSRRTALYRMFDAAGALLYVGITGHLPARIAAHDGEKRWWQDVAAVTVEHFSTRDAASAAETTAIKSENPLYNITHSPNGKRWPVGRAKDGERHGIQYRAAIIPAQGYSAWFDGGQSCPGRHTLPVVGWDSEGEALVASGGGSLIRAHDVQGFMYVSEEYSASFVPAKGWSLKCENGHVQPVVAWGVSPRGIAAPMVAKTRTVEPAFNWNGEFRGTLIYDDHGRRADGRYRRMADACRRLVRRSGNGT